MRLYSNKKIFFLILTLQLLLSIAFPQTSDFKVDHFTVDQGLSQNQVFYIFQDSKGLLWFCTQDGLNLYDGYRFRTFRHQPGNQNSLLDYAVNTICETDTGIFWIGTREGMSRLDLRTGLFTHFVHQPDSLNSLVDNNVWFIKSDSERNIWISTKNGLSKYNPENKQFENFKTGDASKNSISNNFVFAMVEDNNKNLWIGGRGGLDRYDLKEKKFYNYKLSPDRPNDVALNGILSLYIKNDMLWIGAYSGFYSMSLKKSYDEKITFEKHLSDLNIRGSVRSVFGGYDGTLWIGTMGDGLIRYIPETGSVSLYKSSGKPGSISEDYITSLYEDKNNVLWIGTSSSGLNKYNRSSERFNSIVLPPSEGMDNSEVSSLLEDYQGNLWVGTGSGNILKITNHFSGKADFRFYKTEKYLTTYFNKLEIRTLLEDKDGKIWAGSFGNGIYIIDPVTEAVTRIKGDSNKKNSLANDFIHSIYQSSDGTIWIGTGAGGLNKFNRIDKTFTHFKHNPADPKSISTDEVTAVCEDGDGFIWAGTSVGGLNRLNPSTGEFERFSHDVNDISSLSSNRIICLYLDKESNLWIGTFGGGLNKWDQRQNSFEHFTNEQGLPSNIVNWIVEDAMGNLWITTDKGISVYNIEKNLFTNYDVNDGLLSNEFIHGAGFASRINGFIYVGGIKGINFFKPSDLSVKSKISNIVFTDFKIFNKSVTPGEESALKTSILYSDEVILSHDENFITFEFAMLDFNNPDKNQYAYKMEGFNKEWIQSGNQRLATFTNLDPGEYIFRVKATNSNGVWNDTGASIKVILLPPWWQTWWAYILYLLIFIAILYSLRRYEMNRVELRNELQLKDFEAKKLQEVDQLKSHFFANISHEFRTPLTLILGLLQKFETKASDKKDLEDYGVMKRNAVRLLQLINQLLEFSKIESGKAKLAASENDIVSFVKRIFVSFASYAEQKNIKLLFKDRNINEETKESINLFFDKDKMEKIVSNLISNAVKYTPSGNEIEVKVLSQNNFVEVKVVNTGVTISKADLAHLFDRYYKVHRAESGLFEGTGIGLALVKELVELHKGTITASSEYEVTEFTVRLPLGKTHLKEDEIVQDSAEFITEKYEAFGGELSKVISADSEEAAINEEKEIILIVEDHGDLRKYIRENLSEIYHIIESPNGKDGLNKAVEIIPDLIISDVMMPEMDGYTFCKKIKTDPKTNHIPVILLTAKASTEDKLGGLELGADDYLIKPFNPEELKLRVRNLIRTRELLRQKFTSEMVLKPAEVIVPSTQMHFMQKIQNVIESNLEDESFGVDKLAGEAGMSRSQLHRKLKAITNQSTTEFIRNFRLQRAAQLILQDAGSMAEIAYKVGFNSQAYFNKSFQELFGCSPTDYKRSHKT